VTDAVSLRPVDFDPFVRASEREVRIPLTEPQAEMWTAAVMSDEANSAYNQVFVFTLEGPLRVDSLRAALDGVVARHAALRVVVAEDGTGQTICAPFGLDVPLHDLSQLDAAAREQQIARLVDGECTTPFDLVEGPLVRALVVREAPERHRFVMTAHHIVCDGWSSAVLFSDLGRLYAADCVGVPARLDAPASYRDYVVDQTSDRTRAAAAADEDFWAALYPTGAPVLDLPLSGPRPPVKTYRSGRDELRIDEELRAALVRTGATSGVTLFAMLLGAFEVFAYRLSGEPDFVVGVPLAGQPALENAALVGHCVSTVPLRVRLDAEQSFAEHVRAVGDDLAQAHEHSLLTFGSLVRRLNVPRDRSRTPLVSVTFGLDRIGAPFDFGAVSIVSVATPKSYFNFEFAMNVVDDGATLVVETDYNLDLFDTATVRRWLSHYETLLRAVTADPTSPLDSIDLLDAAERERILVEWNDTEELFDEEPRLDTLFEAQVNRRPEADAVIDANERISYAELDRRANRLANRLRTLGVGPDVLVGVCLERSVELIVTLMAVLKAGGAYVPLDPDYPSARIAFMIEDSRAPVIVMRKSLEVDLPSDTQPVYLDEEETAIGREPTTKPPVERAPTDLAYVIYTSGSTGRPNGVQIEHAAVANHMLWMRRHVPFEDSDRILQRTPLSFDASLDEIFAPLAAGACIVMAPPGARRAAAELVDVIAEYGVTIVVLVPSYAQAMMDEFDARKCASLRRVIFGGEPLSASLYREFRRRLGVQVFNFYGPTEASIDATSWPTLDDAASGVADALLDVRDNIPIGRPISNVRAYVLDRSLQPVPLGAVGDLYLAGAGLARGYLGRPELTEERFVVASPRGARTERLYRTGDLARQLPGGIIEYLGRRDHQVKVRGHRIELGEVESALRRPEAVTDAIAVVREDQPGDVRLVAYVVSSTDDDADLPEQLRSSLRADLPDHMIPARIVVLPSLPLLPNGKVDRQALPAPSLEQSHVAADGHVAPRTATEAKVADVWGTALDIESPGVEDDFFESGGHSLVAARVVTALRTEFGVALAMRHLFEQPTIAGLARTVDVLSLATPAPSHDAAADREEVEI
jgi:amino acid adenylation domain-containing protein